MKNNFLSLVTKMPQNTGGGNSQTKRATLALPLRYLCAMLLALFVGVGQMWGQDVTLVDINYTQWDGTAMPANSGLSNSNTYYASNGTSRVATLVGKGCKLDDSSNQPTATGVSGSYEHYLRFGSSGNYLNITASSDLVKNAGETSYGKVRFLVSSQKNKTTDELAEVKIGETSLGKIYAFTSTSTCDWVEFDIPATVSKNATITLTRTTNTLFVWGIQIKTFTSSSSPVSVTGITLAPSSATIKVGKTVTLVPTITPSDATDKAVTWAVTSGSSYASVTDAGVVTGLAAGTAVVTATAHDGSGVTQTATITVEDCPTSGTLFSMTVTDPDGTVYTDVTNAAPQLIGATYVGGKAYATSTSSSKRSPKITGDEFDFNVSSSSSVAVKVELDCPLAEGDMISFTSTHTKEFKIQKVAGTNLHQTSSLSLAIPSGSSLIDEDVFYVLCANSACSFSEINIIRPIYRTITLEYADGVTPDGSLKVIDGEKAAKPADPTWAHHRFDGWYNGASPYDWTATVSGDLTLTAHWTQLYTVTYAKGDESATGDAPTQEDKAATETFKVAANTFELAGKVFDHWNDGTADYDPEDTYTVGTSNVTLTAIWRTPSTMYAITKGAHENGDFTIDPASQEAGEVVTLEATPDEDYLFSAWDVYKTGESSTKVSVTNNKFNMPEYGVTVNATFVADPRAKVLYLTTNSADATKTNDKLYAALKDAYNVKIQAPASQTLTDYALVVLHESIGGTSDAAAVTGCKTTSVPVLNTKSYFYGADKDASKRWTWGAPNAGTSVNGATLNSAYCNIASHPLFNDVTVSEGFFAITTDAAEKCMQPVGSFATGYEGYTLATTPNAATPGGTGCAIHEIPAGTTARGALSGKYLMISVSNAKLNDLNANGQKLFQNAAAYLIGSSEWSPVLAPATEGIVASPAASYSEGDDISLSITATNVDAATTTYTWFKGATLAAAEEAGAIQAAKTIAESGNVYAKASCLAEDAGTYWCVITKSTGCELSASLDVTVLTCTKPGTPANLAASNIAYTTADLSWDAADNADGYKISIIKKEGEDVILDWTDNTTTSYAATGLTQGTEYTFKVKAKGASGYCEFGLEATVDFTTTAPSVADLVTIADDYTFTPSVSIPVGTLSADSKFFAAGTGDCDMSDGKMRVKTNRALAFKVAAGARIKVTFATSGSRQIQLGNSLTQDANPEGNYHYGYSTTSPYTFDDVTTGGVVYLTAHDNQLYFSKIEIFYPHTVTYDLNGGTGDPVPTQASKYVGETFTAHDGVTGITTPTGKEFSKWKDQDEADVLGGATYTMPAKAVTLTAQWIDPPTRYTVSFDLQGHGSAITSQSVADGEKALKPADPSESGWDFEGWYTDAACTAGNEFDFNTAIIADRPLFAKWTEFDACAVLTPATSGETIGVGDEISLQTGSVGGTMEAVVKSGETTTNLVYTENGLAFNSSGDRARVKVTLSHKLQKGSIIRVTLKANGDNSRDRGLDIYNEAGTKKGFLGFAKDGYENGDVAKFSYVVTDDDGLKNTKVFYLYRNNSVWMADLKVANCAPQDFTVTYKDGETTLGTEDVFENGHPTAAGVNTRKSGYVFDGWAETDGGAVVNLSTITITAAKTLYAKYEAVVCPTSGTVYKFEIKDELSSENLPTSTDKDMSSYINATGDGYLTYTATANNKATINSDGTIQMKDASAAYLKVELECALAAGDQIRAHVTNNPIRVQVAATYDSGKDLILAKDDYTFVDITSAMEGKQVLYITRSTNGNSNIADFEIYRRPVLTGVSLNELTVRVGAVANPEMTLTPSNDAIVTNQAWSIVSGSDKITIDATGAVTGKAAGDAVIKVILNGDAEHFSATATVHVVNDYARQDVTGSMEWNWANSGPLSGVTAQENNNVTETLLANIGTMPNNAEFRSDMLVTTCQHAYRSGTGNGCWQGTEIKFYTTVPGAVKVNYMGTGSNDEVTLSINNWSNTYAGSWTDSKTIVVPAGWVTISASESNKLRIKTITFTAAAKLNAAKVHDEAYYYNGYDRNVTEGRFGTICLPNGGVMVGAELYEVAYKDPSLNKIFFDQVVNGEMIAGRPYIFLPKKGASQLAVFYTDATDAPAGNYHGLYGSYTEELIADGVGNYILSNNQYREVAAGGVAYVTPNRAYFKYEEIPGTAYTPLPGRKRMSIGAAAPAVATGMDELNASEAPAKMLINGQLFILRGDKMYDAKGQLVK